jgi:hypothetical protein
MWLQSSLLWAGMALVASAKSYHVDKLVRAVLIISALVAVK